MKPNFLTFCLSLDNLYNDCYVFIYLFITIR